MTEIKQTMAEVQAEARRCLYCVDAPCQQGCPAGVDVAQFIRHLRYADVKSAKRVIKTANPLGGICGTLCPSENLCQKFDYGILPHSNIRYSLPKEQFRIDC